MALTDKAITNTLKNKPLRAELALKFDRTDQTICKWIKTNHIYMSQGEAVDLIHKYTELKKTEITTSKKARK